MRILTVESDPAVSQSIELMLKSEGFNVFTTDLGEEAVELAKLYDYDLITLAINLPDISGLAVLKQLRTGRQRTPILVLSGLAGVEDKVKALGMGADDYMTKPFHKDELIARINAIVRRSKGHPRSTLQIGSLLVDLDARATTIDGESMHLTGKEYAMVELMALRKDSLITKEMFLNHLYGGMDEPEIKIIDVFICKLRKKFAKHDAAHLIRTTWGRGYSLTEGLPMPGAPSLAPEIRDMIDEPPIHVSRRTHTEAEVHNANKRFGVPKVKSPPLVPELGE